jgi:hypothetical protein
MQVEQQMQITMPFRLNSILVQMKRRTKNAQRHRQLSCHGMMTWLNTQIDNEVQE